MPHRIRTVSLRPTPRAIFGAALAAGALASLAPAAALAGEPRESFRVDVDAPSGKGCISSQKLEAAVRKHVRGEPRAEKVDVRIEAADPGPGWVAEVTVDGKSGRRTVKASGAACSQLDEGLVLVLALLADPDDDAPADGDKHDGDAKPKGSWGEDEPASDEPQKPETPAKPVEPEPAEEPEKPAKPEPPIVPETADQAARKGAETPDLSKQAVSRKRRTQMGLGVSTVYSSGLLSVPAGGVRAAVTWLQPTPVALEAAFTFHLPQGSDSDTVSPDKTQYLQGAALVAWHLDAVTTELNVCPKFDVWRLHLGVCGGAALTYVHYSEQTQPVTPTDSANVPVYLEYSKFVLSQTTDFRLDISVASFLRAGAGFQVLVPLMYDHDYNALSGPGATSHNFAGFAGRLGVTLVLPP